VSKLEEFIEQSDRVNCSPEDVGRSEAKRFKRWVTDDIKKKTASIYISQIDKMARFYTSHDYYQGNPFEGLTETIDTKNSKNRSKSYQDNERITVEDSSLREAIRSTHGTQKIVLLALLVKTGVRVSEACNLNWEDITIDHDLADDLLPEPRFELSDYSDVIYIDCTKTRETYDRNTEGNKRKVDSRIPIDAELKRLLLWHTITRERRFDDQNPVFMVNDGPGNKSSDRLAAYTAWKRVKELAKEYGWYETGRSEMQNITPHWFRAKFGSYMEKRLEAAKQSEKSDFSAKPRDVIKGLRGDVPDDVAEGYRLREDDHFKYIRPRQFKIGLEGV
jgi:integrase